MVSWHIFLELDREAMPEEVIVHTKPEQSGAAPSKEILKEPPALILRNRNSSMEVRAGTASWSYSKGDGTWSGVISCGMHPLDSQVSLESFAVTDDKLELLFATEPDSFTLRCWSDEDRGNTEAETVPVALEGNILFLEPGGYICEVSASWNANPSQYHGTANYCFYIICE